VTHKFYVSLLKEKCNNKEIKVYKISYLNNKQFLRSMQKNNKLHLNKE